VGARKWGAIAFQSLIGILVDFNRYKLKPLQYLVFKVQWCKPVIIISFQPLGDKRASQNFSLKALYSKRFAIGADLFSLLNR
ncbi:hypothetical protein, partial [Fischerella thermalis]|uniref:hypothetical protein n=1 Tax=Fischerella thermalis TaxID=372787 RepID=UPI000CBAFD09